MKLELVDLEGSIKGTIELPLEELKTALALPKLSEEAKAGLASSESSNDAAQLKESQVKITQLEGDNAGLEDSLAEAVGRTMDDYSPIEKATFVIPWLRDLPTADFVMLARNTGHEAQLVPAAAAEVAEVVAEGEPKKEEVFIQGKTDLPGYKYFPNVDLSIKE